MDITLALHDKGEPNNDNVKFRTLVNSPTVFDVGCTFNEEFRSYSMNSDANDECLTGLTNSLDVGSIYGSEIVNSNLQVINGSGHNISVNGYVIGSFNRVANATPAFPFCRPKYLNPEYPNKVLDAYNCNTCETRKPQFCPPNIDQGCDPCTKVSKQTNNASQVEEMIINPNPSFDYIQVSNLDINSDLKIYSLLGECILTTFNRLEQEYINVTKFKAGIYIIQNGQNKRGKFVKSD